jgi:hypothetical protein
MLRGGTLLFATGCVGMVLASSARSDAAISDLWVTEVVPDTGQVEVTNIGADPVTMTSNFRWCHRFTYAGVVASDTTFAPGESRVFTVSGLNASLSEIWLYQAPAFGGSVGEASIVGGLKYGGSAVVGREGVATNAGVWDGTASFVPLPPTVPPFPQSLQVTGANPFAAAHWTLGAPNLGSYAPPQAAFRITSISQPDAGLVTVGWEGGEPPYQVQSSTDLANENWQNLGPRTNATRATRTVPGETQFFRVLSGLPALTAAYDVTFTATWAQGTHPNFPGGAHFTGLIGGTHSSNVTFWEPGALASPGMESMAETGSKSPLDTEVNAAIAAGTAQNLLSGGGLSSTPGTVTLRFSVSLDFPLVSLVSMIAPSPDWFIGVHDLNLLADGQWVEDMIVPLPPYDAGTDSGGTFTSGNVETFPPEAIFEIIGAPLSNNGAVAPFGSFRFVRVP